MSTSAFLQTMLANRLPIPLIEVRANIIFCLPSTFVFRTRRICWNSSFATKDYTSLQNLNQKTNTFQMVITIVIPETKTNLRASRFWTGEKNIKVGFQLQMEKITFYQRKMVITIVICRDEIRESSKPSSSSDDLCRLEHKTKEDCQRFSAVYIDTSLLGFS